MGQTEVLEWLRVQRVSCDDRFRSYAEIHKGMRKDGHTMGYQGVWWSIVCLYDQGRIEGVAMGSVLSRRWVFRAKQPVHTTSSDQVSGSTVVHSSGMKEDYNILRNKKEKSGRSIQGGVN